MGQMQSKPCEWPAVYPAFALRVTSLGDQTSSFSTNECTVLETSQRPSVRTSGGTTGSGRREASKVIIQRKSHSLPKKSLVLHRKQGLRVCTLNTWTLFHWSSYVAGRGTPEMEHPGGRSPRSKVVGQWRGQHR